MTNATDSAVSYQTETATALWPELMPLLERHKDEVGHYPQDVLKPQMAMYERLEAIGGLRVYTARIAPWDLIGYLAFLVGPNPHYADTIMANCDVLYVAPEHRKSGVGYGIMQFARQRLKADGVHCIAMRTKAKKELNFGRLLLAMGYEKVDEVWLLRVA